MKIHDLVPRSNQTIEYSYKCSDKKMEWGPIYTIMTYQGYDINGYKFYMVAQDEKSIY